MHLAFPSCGEKMVKLIKRGDNYKAEKLKGSIISAGASSDVADKIVSSIKVREGMSTLELRRQVSDLLKKSDPKVAKAYDTYKST
jgi:hypothetical protein